MIKNLQSLKQTLSNRLRTDIDALRVLTYAVAMTVAYNKTSLPSSKVEMMSAHYRNHVAIQAGQFLSELTEVGMIDFDQAQALIYKFWAIRYRAAHEPNLLFGSPNGFFTTIFGVEIELAPNERKYIEDNATKIIDIATIVSSAEFA